MTPHVAQNSSGRSWAIDARTTWHGGYAASQRVRKPSEEAFGWIKTVATQEKTKFCDRSRSGGLHLRCRCLQSGSIAEARHGKGLIAKPSSTLIELSLSTSTRATTRASLADRALTSSTASSLVRFQGAARSFSLRRRGLRRSFTQMGRAYQRTLRPSATKSKPLDEISSLPSLG